MSELYVISCYLVGLLLGISIGYVLGLRKMKNIAIDTIRKTQESNQ